MSTVIQVIGTRKEHEKFLFKKKDVVSAGVGYKVVNGQKTNQICLVVGVKEKKPFSTLSKKDVIQQSVDGIPTDVVEVGMPVAQNKSRSQNIIPTNKYRPIIPGTSIGHGGSTAGTFGFVAKLNGQTVIVSNNHVIANQNNAKIGDAIYQPGVYDGGSEADKVAELLEFIPLQIVGIQPPSCGVTKKIEKALNFIAAKIGSSHRLMAIKQGQPSAVTNLVDCAIATPTVEVVEEIAQIGKPTGTRKPELGTKVQKFGRTTRYTTGTIDQIHATVRVSYDAGIATFTDQVILSGMSAGGDSGSAILDMDNKLIGLLFAGSRSITIANPIETVFEMLFGLMLP